MPLRSNFERVSQEGISQNCDHLREHGAIYSSERMNFKARLAYAPIITGEKAGLALALHGVPIAALHIKTPRA